MPKYDDEEKAKKNDLASAIGIAVAVSYRALSGRLSGLYFGESCEVDCEGSNVSVGSARAGAHQHVHVSVILLSHLVC
jgi:hypothetical protein